MVTKKHTEKPEEPEKVEERVAAEDVAAPAEEQPISTESTESAELAAARREAEEFRDRWLRSAAELDNYRRRVARDGHDQAARAGERVLRGMLEPIDNLARGIRQATEVLSPSEGETGAAIVQGLEMVYGQFLALLARENVRPMVSIGTTFDPNLHEAIMMIDREDVAQNTVVDEIERGYWLGDRVLRHAKVVVSRPPAQSRMDVSDTE